MATLADELLADFDDSDNSATEDNEDLNHGGLFPESSSNGNLISNGTGMEFEDDDEAEDPDAMQGLEEGVNDDEDDEEQAKAKIERMDLRNVELDKIGSGLMRQLTPILNRIESQPTTADVIGNPEDDPEYVLMTESNKYATMIDSEIQIVHKWCRDHYSTRFPELETLVSNPIDYCKTVKILANHTFDNETMKSLAAPLREVLPAPSIMIVTVESTTTTGRQLNDTELTRVIRGCDLALDLEKAKHILIQYVQSRIHKFAPNLQALIGSAVAAQLLAVSGGLTSLAKTPACNLAALGSKKQANQGMATNVGIRQQGYLYHSQFVQGVAADLRRQAMRIVSAKIVLAARIDRVHSSPNGAEGENIKASCIERLEKLAEPAKNRGNRALPAPDDKPARKRGGRRARLAKAATAMTDLRKAQNRMTFGKEEKEVGYGTGEGTVGMGMIGAANDGRIRNLQVDQRTRAKLSAKNKGWGGATPVSGAASSLRGFGQVPGAIDLRGRGIRTSGVGSVIAGSSGTASSLAFTPVQGLELVDPKRIAEMNRKRKADDDKWFKGGTFTQVGSASSTSNDGFKRPELPAAKRVDTGKGKMGPPSLPGSGA